MCFSVVGRTDEKAFVTLNRVLSPRVVLPPERRSGVATGFWLASAAYYTKNEKITTKSVRRVTIDLDGNWNTLRQANSVRGGTLLNILHWHADA